MFGLYVHWPFCKSKCPYCDFNSHVRAQVDHGRWRAALLREMEETASRTGPRMLNSIFFGGGTPSLMEPETVAAVIETAKRLWQPAEDIEITLEANPTSVEAEKFRGFARGGVNRLSMGIQSLDDQVLTFLGREHSAHEAKGAIELARDTFDRYSFDLIYTRPGQSVAQWRDELDQALKLCGDHLSLYQLTIEPGTAFHTRHRLGEFEMPDEDLSAALYEETQSHLEARGMPAYEVSNHAIPGGESRHNLVYWRYQDYAGIGPGAHGRLTVDGMKRAEIRARLPEKWLGLVEEKGEALSELETIDEEQQFQEALLMGLRLKEGVPLDRLPVPQWNMLRNSGRIEALAAEELLTLTPEKLQVTEEGRHRLNAVLGYLVG
ncbi:radical SAM family heme chaperone HemW [Aestuariispira insulae]|uniref:Heme chaperone HemW n=1 Tax=Aestuariispira insulae TaxID=1461337 RepID=A0A3D9HPN9_9PROT|nr:radical SAM family heme chaperone HemW [Aestuariispira insulae]RED51440.1 oxygen-independent coproporphyrinogen-3 oxidase [Aestuariispira insulae]